MTTSTKKGTTNSTAASTQELDVLTTKLGEIERVRGLLADAAADLERTGDALRRAELQLADEQGEVALFGSGPKKTSAVAAVTNLLETITLLQARRSGLRSRLEGLLAELGALRQAGQNELNQWTWREAEVAERDYITALTTFSAALAKYAALADTLALTSRGVALRNIALPLFDREGRVFRVRHPVVVAPEDAAVVDAVAQHRARYRAAMSEAEGEQRQQA